MWIIVFLIFLIFLISYFLWAPVIIELDSSKEFYGIRFHRLVSSEIKIVDDSFLMILRIAGWEKRFDLFDRISIHSKKLENKTAKKRKTLSFNKLINVARSFKMKKFALSIDTGNMQMNGILFPFFFWMGEISKKSIAINFKGENRIELRLENNFARILRVYIKS